MNCEKCGAELTPEAIFCSKCGASQGEGSHTQSSAGSAISGPKKKRGLILGISLGVIVLLAIALAVYFLQPAPNVFSEEELASIKAVALDRMEGVAEILDLPVDINVTIEDMELDGIIFCSECSGKTRNYEVEFDITGEGLSDTQMASLVFIMEYMYGSSNTSEGFDQNLDSPHDLSTVYDIHQDNPFYQGSAISSAPMGVRNLPTDFPWTVTTSFTVNGNWLGYIASGSPRSSSVVIGLDNPVSVSDILSALPPR